MTKVTARDYGCVEIFKECHHRFGELGHSWFEESLNSNQKGKKKKKDAICRDDQ